MMKHSKKRILQYLLVNNICWFFAAPFVYIAKRLELSRANFKQIKTEDENIAICNKIFFKKEVIRGFFKGLIYGDVKPTGSSIYAKLLGCYELEIQPIVQQTLNNNFNNLVNIGSDEGYYAVGFARANSNLKVAAFDCNKNAQKKCKQLAEINNVHQQIDVKGCFNETDINHLKNIGKTLFIVDCEGCEDVVITKKLVSDFATATFIIELHYQPAPMVFENLQQVFKNNHRIKIIKALTDHERVVQYQYPELQGLTYQQKEYILSERFNYMEWLIAEPLQ
jgi:hypothetical protein